MKAKNSLAEVEDSWVCWQIAYTEAHLHSSRKHAGTQNFQSVGFKTSINRS